MSESNNDCYECSYNQGAQEPEYPYPRWSRPILGIEYIRCYIADFLAEEYSPDQEERDEDERADDVEIHDGWRIFSMRVLISHASDGERRSPL